jgi:Flp pilus assembly protein TadG
MIDDPCARAHGPRKPLCAIRAFSRSEKAEVSVEFALVALLAIPLFFGIFEMGRAFYNKTTLDYLADEIARAAAIQLDSVAIDTAFMDAAMEEALNDVAIFIDRNTLDRRLVSNNGETTVVLSYPHQLRVPMILDETITLTATRILR